MTIRESNKMNKYIGHRSEDGREETVIRHLEATAKSCQNFASDFGAGGWGYEIGKLHDIGKYSLEFQNRILHDGPRVDHATAGAKEIYNSETNKLKGTIAAYCIAGHHSGIPDGGSLADTSEMATLCGRLQKDVADCEAFRKEIHINKLPRPQVRLLEKGGFTVSFFTRMLYSALVDADFLETERFMEDGKTDRGEYESMEKLMNRLSEYILPWFKGETNALNKKRCEILENCLKKGIGERGLYSLTVPTGGGKTVSSLAFALRHAVQNNMKRIIYVIPYTSIIEQNASVFKRILGEQNVLEHHSNVEYDDDSESNRKQLATENWDMPIIVTTNVRFFESIFANKSSGCRKLHNITNSVVVFDEAQMLPTEYLKPCVQAMAELVHNYRSSVMLCTATQPSLQKLFPSPLACEEISENIEELYDFFKRTNIQFEGDISIDDLVIQINQKKQVLCVVNSKRNAQNLYQRLEGEGTYHLSTYMYPRHRKSVLQCIKEDLEMGKECRVISTSLVEAGVDLDFNCVYRELAGLDSIIQAAGRCNREGLQEISESKVYVFEFPKEESCNVPTEMKQSKVITEQIIKAHKNISSLDAVKQYFDQLHYIKGDRLDKKRIVKQFEDAKLDNKIVSFPFATVAKEFKLIENDTKMIVINKEYEVNELVEQLRKDIRSRDLVRKVGQFSVSVYKNDYEALYGAGMLEVLDDEIAILKNLETYTDGMGLDIKVQRGEAVFL